MWESKQSHIGTGVEGHTDLSICAWRDLFLSLEKYSSPLRRPGLQHEWTLLFGSNLGSVQRCIYFFPKAPFSFFTQGEKIGGSFPSTNSFTWRKCGK